MIRKRYKRYDKTTSTRVDEKTYELIEAKARELNMNKSEFIRMLIEVGLTIITKGSYDNKKNVINVNAPISVSIATAKAEVNIDRETIRELIKWLERIANKNTDYPQGLKNIALRSLSELQKLLDHN
jgi:hypothetical protein